ncbi:hypothetical protein DM02DRAFT_137032 [Periconia macrospinosa]|uniref:Uncharacterized protein n=1 Tax=Periconia macrospinosa TaxID=97972 RepID=A0A2V1DE82_9PLEO|nr:hypothetical protein DM02DRAFT_137032 [Periconia macrospinosa]
MLGSCFWRVEREVASDESLWGGRSGVGQLQRELLAYASCSLTPSASPKGLIVGPQSDICLLLYRSPVNLSPRPCVCSTAALSCCVGLGTEWAALSSYGNAWVSRWSRLTVWVRKGLRAWAASSANTSFVQKTLYIGYKAMHLPLVCSEDLSAFSCFARKLLRREQEGSIPWKLGSMDMDMAMGCEAWWWSKYCSAAKPFWALAYKSTSDDKSTIPLTLPPKYTEPTHHLTRGVLKSTPASIRLPGPMLTQVRGVHGGRGIVESWMQTHRPSAVCCRCTRSRALQGVSQF